MSCESSLHVIHGIGIYNSYEPSRDHKEKCLYYVCVKGQGKVLNEEQAEHVLKHVSNLVLPEEVDKFHETLYEKKDDEYHMKFYEFKFME